MPMTAPNRARRRRNPWSASNFLVHAAVAVGVIAATVAFLPRRPVEAAKPTEDVTIPCARAMTDPEFIHAGSELASRDIDYLVDRLQRRQAAASATKQDEARRLAATASFLARGRAAVPQAVRFQIAAHGANLTMVPLCWRDAPATRRQVAADVVIVGGEFEAVVTAMAAADRGMKVALLYAGSLGGLVSDTGGNLRYFDGIPGTPRPTEQLRLFHDGLGMARGNLVSLPTDISARLRRYLARRYSGRIISVETASYDSLHVAKDGSSISHLSTDEGVVVTGRRYVDMDPESRVAEKAGLPITIDTPNMSYGVVFDVTGIQPGDWANLRRGSLVSPARILAFAGVPESAAHRGNSLAAYVAKQRRRQGQNFVCTSTYYRFGYSALAEGFNLYMHCLGAREPSNAGLQWLNSVRCTSGFNISQYGGRTTFNSISYHLPMTVLQHDHNLQTDAAFSPIRDIDMPALTRYLQWVTGNSRIRVVMPRQFYVRTPTAFFPTVRPYEPNDFVSHPQTRLWMVYEMDFRDARPRDRFEYPLFHSMFAGNGGRKRWDCRPTSTDTTIPNLFLLNKCAMTPRYSGGLRILQNLTSTGVALMARFHTEGVASGQPILAGNTGGGGTSRMFAKKGASKSRTRSSGSPTTL